MNYLSKRHLSLDDIGEHIHKLDDSVCNVLLNDEIVEKYEILHFSTKIIVYNNLNYEIYEIVYKNIDRHCEKLKVEILKKLSSVNIFTELVDCWTSLSIKIKYISSFLVTYTNKVTDLNNSIESIGRTLFHEKILLEAEVGNRIAEKISAIVLENNKIRNHTIEMKNFIVFLGFFEKMESSMFTRSKEVYKNTLKQIYIEKYKEIYGKEKILDYIKDTIQIIQLNTQYYESHINIEITELLLELLIYPVQNEVYTVFSTIIYRRTMA